MLFLDAQDEEIRQEVPEDAKKLDIATVPEYTNLREVLEKSAVQILTIWEAELADLELVLSWKQLEALSVRFLEPGRPVRFPAPSLKRLGFGSVSRIPFDSFSSLENLTLFHSSGATLTGLNQVDLPRLEEVQLEQNSLKDLRICERAPLLNYLRLNESKFGSTAGLESAKSLQKLEMACCKIPEPERIATLPSLVDLDVQSSKGIQDLSEILAPNLDRLSINGLKLPSLEPLRHLKKLRVLHMDKVTVADDNYDVFLDLPALDRVLLSKKLKEKTRHIAEARPGLMRY